MADPLTNAPSAAGHTHPHEHDHAHPHEHDHPHHHHGHSHAASIIGKIGEALHLPGFAHHHHAGEADLVVDPALRDNNLGILTVWVALGLLWVTAVFQALIYYSSGSVALLGDTTHNLVDGLNSIPLLAALYLARRAATRRFTYGFGRAEDIAGIFIVLSIVVSAIHILYESFHRFFNPFPLENIPLIALAALGGFVGNEIVASLQIGVGRRIGSVAMVADGQHARIDGVTSLAVLVAALGAAIGIPILDPIIGVLIGITILGIAWSATRKVFYRLMDAVEPSLMHQLEHYISEVEGVEELTHLRARWVGHRLFVEASILMAEERTLVESAAVSQRISRLLRQVIPALGEVTVHTAPRFAPAPGSNGNASAGGLATLLPPPLRQCHPQCRPDGCGGAQAG
ncbi:MAG: cation transporter [Anaerolineae bacterium]|nr:cation transporter [Anaerolineae bacterium]